MKANFNGSGGNGNVEDARAMVPEVDDRSMLEQLQNLVARYERKMRGRGHHDFPSLVASTIDRIYDDSVRVLQGQGHDGQGLEDFGLLSRVAWAFPQYKSEFDFGVREAFENPRMIHGLINMTDQGEAYGRMYGVVQDNPVVTKYLCDVVEEQYACLIWDTIERNARQAKYEALVYPALKDAALRSIAKGGERPSANWIQEFGINPGAEVPLAQLLAATDSAIDKCFSKAPELAAATKSGLRAMMKREGRDYRPQDNFTL